MGLSRDQILSSKRPPTEVQVPEWGGSVYIKTMSAGHREQWESSFDSNLNNKAVRASILVLTLCDENGVLLFSPDDVAKLNEQDGHIIDRLFQEATKHNRILKEASEEAKKN